MSSATPCNVTSSASLGQIKHGLQIWVRAARRLPRRRERASALKNMSSGMVLSFWPTAVARLPLAQLYHFV